MNFRFMANHSIREKVCIEIARMHETSTVHAINTEIVALNAFVYLSIYRASVLLLQISHMIHRIDRSSSQCADYIRRMEKKLEERQQ